MVISLFTADAYTLDTLTAANDFDTLVAANNFDILAAANDFDTLASANEFNRLVAINAFDALTKQFRRGQINSFLKNIISVVNKFNFLATVHDSWE